MINANRWLDIAIFSIEEPVMVDGKTIEKGFQQVFRVGEKYIFAKIGEKPYLELSIKDNERIVKVIYSKEVIDP